MMTNTTTDLQWLAVRAAQAVGFTSAQAETFGRATIRHVAEERDCAAVLDALRDPSDSPILRLPLMLEDLMSACAALGGTAELTLQPDDARLAPSYAELLPVHLTECDVITREAHPRLRISTDAGKPTKGDVPPDITAPDYLIDQLKSLAGLGSAHRHPAPSGPAQSDRR